MTRIAIAIAAGLMALLAASCATLSVGSYVEHGTDFAQYRTWDWAPPDALPTGDPRLDHNAFFQDHLQGAIEKQLAARGLTRGNRGHADLLVHYHASVTQRLDVNGIDREHGYCRDEDCLPRVIAYDAGTLVLDIIDARTSRLVWRGWAQDSLQGVIDNQDRLDASVDRAVARMMARLPVSLMVSLRPA